MKRMTYKEACQRALAAGATQAEIVEETRKQDRQRGSIPHRNMIVALQLCAYRNTREEWVRLAGALAPKQRKEVT